MAQREGVGTITTILILDHYDPLLLLARLVPLLLLSPVVVRLAPLGGLLPLTFSQQGLPLILSHLYLDSHRNGTLSRLCMLVGLVAPRRLVPVLVLGLAPSRSLPIETAVWHRIHLHRLPDNRPVRERPPTRISRPRLRIRLQPFLATIADEEVDEAATDTDEAAPGSYRLEEEEEAEWAGAIQVVVGTQLGRAVEVVVPDLARPFPWVLEPTGRPLRAPPKFAPAFLGMNDSLLRQPSRWKRSVSEPLSERTIDSRWKRSSKRRRRLSEGRTNLWEVRNGLTRSGCWRKGSRGV